MTGRDDRMTLTADALWLNGFFAGYDRAVLSFAHKLSELAGSFLTPLNRIISFLGEKGLLFLLLALILLLFPRWRRTGVCVILSIACGALISNLLLKPFIARPRPFETVELFRQWWQAVGSPAEAGFSFPSGHVTAAAAGAASLCLTRGRRWTLPAVVWVLLMMFSRNYLMVHYPSDVLFAALIGVFSAFIAALLTKLLFRFLESHDGEGPVYDFLLYAGVFDLTDLRPPKKGVRVSPMRTAKSSYVEELPEKEEASVSDEPVPASLPEEYPAPVQAERVPAHAARGSARGSSAYVGKH